MNIRKAQRSTTLEIWFDDDYNGTFNQWSSLKTQANLSNLVFMKILEGVNYFV